MTKRTNIVNQVGTYFASKGKVLTAEEYKKATDTPIRFQQVKRGIGSWSRLLNMVGDINQYNVAPPVDVIVEEEIATETPVQEVAVETPKTKGV